MGVVDSLVGVVDSLVGVFDSIVGVVDSLVGVVDSLMWVVDSIKYPHDTIKYPNETIKYPTRLSNTPQDYQIPPQDHQILLTWLSSSLARTFHVMFTLCLQGSYTSNSFNNFAANFNNDTEPNLETEHDFSIWSKMTWLYHQMIALGVSFYEKRTISLKKICRPNMTHWNLKSCSFFVSIFHILLLKNKIDYNFQK